VALDIPSAGRFTRSGEDALVSVLILTKDEVSNIGLCLDSVAWSDDVHVLDSLSTDGTPEAARRFGAHVAQRAFDGFASQRNYGLHQLPFRHEWVLILDADERVPEGLAREIRQFARTAPASAAAARIRRRDIWWGRWLRHAQMSPFYVRLVRPRRVRYEREVNEFLAVDGDTVDLSGYFDHYPFSKGLTHWIAKHNMYSDMEAQIVARNAVAHPSLRIALSGRDFNERRLHQKAIFYRMPCRSLVKLAYMLLWRRSFLDGLPGIRYTILICVYQYLIVLKTKELRAADAARNAAAPRTARRAGEPASGDPGHSEGRLPEAEKGGIHEPQR
jgi:glycosyltransferase involved in cell wall biosynthesis